MKKILLTVLAFVLLLTACSPKNEPTNGDSDNATAPPSEQTSAPASAQDGETVALRIGGVEITSNEYRYHYYTNMQSIISLYGSIMGIDESLPLEEQFFDEAEGVTWADFFTEQAIAGLRNTVLLSVQAEKAGMTLDETFKNSINKKIDELKSICDSNGVTIEELLNRYYGGSMNEETLRKIMERTYFGYQYELHKRASADTSDAALQDYYNRHAGEFDAVDYYSYMFETKEEADKCLADVTDEASFSEYLKSNYDEELSDYHSFGEGNGGDKISDWLFDAARTEGDIAIIEEYDVFLVILFQKRYRPEEETLSIRHILISNESRTYDEVQARANEIYDEWKNGAATEDSFAALATNYTDDPGSLQSGGLYEDVYEGQMVEPFDSWCFDPARKVGDSGLVDTEYGTHIMYYVGYVQGWKNQVEQAYVEEAYSQFYDSVLSDFEVEQIDINVAK